MPNLPGASGVIALIAANLFVVSFGMSWGPMVWVLLGEMFPNRIRAAALGLAAAGQWVANWLITVTFPGLRDHLGAAYGFYGVCAFLSFLFVWKWVRRPRANTSKICTARLTARPRPSRLAVAGAPQPPAASNPRDRPGGRVEQSRAVKTFDALFAELSEKARTRPEGSGTVAALDGGVHGLGKKILEEAGEVWLAAEYEGDDALAEEVSQLLYWTQVLLISRGLSLDDVYRKL